MVSRIVLAVVVAVVVGLLCILLGAVLGTLNVEPLAVVGGFLAAYGWVIGVLAGVWYFFSRGGLG